MTTFHSDPTRADIAKFAGEHLDEVEKLIILTMNLRKEVTEKQFGDSQMGQELLLQIIALRKEQVKLCSEVIELLIKTATIRDVLSYLREKLFDKAN